MDGPSLLIEQRGQDFEHAPAEIRIEEPFIESKQPLRIRSFRTADLIDHNACPYHVECYSDGTPHERLAYGQVGGLTDVVNPNPAHQLPERPSISHGHRYIIEGPDQAEPNAGEEIATAGGDEQGTEEIIDAPAYEAVCEPSQDPRRESLIYEINHA